MRDLGQERRCATPKVTQCGAAEPGWNSTLTSDCSFNPSRNSKQSSPKIISIGNICIFLFSLSPISSNQGYKWSSNHAHREHGAFVRAHVLVQVFLVLAESVQELLKRANKIPLPGQKNRLEAGTNTRTQQRFFPAGKVMAGGSFVLSALPYFPCFLPGITVFHL